MFRRSVRCGDCSSPGGMVYRQPKAESGAHDPPRRRPAVSRRRSSAVPLHSGGRRFISERGMSSESPEDAKTRGGALVDDLRGSPLERARRRAIIDRARPGRARSPIALDAEPPPLPSGGPLPLEAAHAVTRSASDAAPLIAPLAETETQEASPLDPWFPQASSLPSPALSVSGPNFGAARPNPTPTGVRVERLGLPPAMELDRPRIHVRRSESVIREAAVSRSPMTRAGHAARHASWGVARVLSTIGSAAASLVGAHSVAAVRMFESLPRRKQILWVLTPYVVVVALVFLLVYLRDPGRSAGTVAPISIHVPEREVPEQGNTVASGQRPDPYPEAVRSSPQEFAREGSPPEPVHADTEPEIVDARSRLAEPRSQVLGRESPIIEGGPRIPVRGRTPPIRGALASPAPMPAEGLSEVDRSASASQGGGLPHVLAIDSYLRAKPDPRARRVARLKSRRSITVYPRFPAQHGWILGQKSSGEIGFLPLAHLSGRKDPDLDVAPRRTSGKPRRKAAIDPFTALERPRSRRGLRP